MHAPRHRPDWCPSAKEELIAGATVDDPFLSAHEIRDELGLTCISTETNGVECTKRELLAISPLKKMHLEERHCQA